MKLEGAMCDEKKVQLKSGVEGYQTRHETYDGKTFIVAPVVFLVEGVHIGMDGVPTYYPPETLRNAYQHWNDSPLPISHPPDGVECGLPNFLEENVVGRLFNVVFDNDKLRGEVWVDVEKCEKKDPTLLARIRSGEPIEVSTGFSSIEENVEGVWNGEEYSRIIRLMIPDHLALLPVTKGACSVDDGCGIRANMKGGEAMQFKGVKIEKLESDLLERWKSFIENAKKNPAFEEIQMALQKEIDKLDNAQMMHFIVSVTANEVIYESVPKPEGPGGEPKTYRQSYTFKENDQVAELTGEKQEVRRKVEYVPINNQETEEEIDMSKKAEKCCEEQVTFLIQNEATPYKEGDEETLIAFGEERLAAMVGFYEALEPAPKPEKKKNEEPDPEPPPTDDAKPKTLEQYIEDAPAEIRPVLKHSLQVYNANKSALIDKIVSAKDGVFTKEELEAKDFDELKKLASFVVVEDTPADFTGAPGSVRNVNETEEEPLEIPDMTAKK
jgi:hypothetical protein